MQPAAKGLENPNVWNSLHPLQNIGVAGRKIHAVCAQYVGHSALKFILEIAKKYQQYISCSLFRQTIPVLELALRSFS